MNQDTFNFLPVNVQSEPEQRLKSVKDDLNISGEARDCNRTPDASGYSSESRGGQNSFDICANYHKNADTSVAAIPGVNAKKYQQYAILRALQSVGEATCGNSRNVWVSRHRKRGRQSFGRLREFWLVKPDSSLTRRQFPTTSPTSTPCTKRRRC